MRRIEDDRVHPRADERRGAFVRVTGDADRRADRDAGRFRPAHLVDLLGHREVTVDHSEAAEESQRDRQARVGDGVHGGGEDRNPEHQLVREARRGRDLGRKYVAAGRDQEDVVEGQAFLGELLLPVQYTGLTRASVSAGALWRALLGERPRERGAAARPCVERLDTPLAPRACPPREHDRGREADEAGTREKDRLQVPEQVEAVGDDGKREEHQRLHFDQE